MVARLDRNRPLPEPAQPRVEDGVTQRAFTAIFVVLRDVVKFLQPFAQPEKWQPLPFRTGWENFGTPVQNAAYRKSPLGRVELRGHVKRTAGVTTEIANLPQSHWPAKGKLFAVYSNLAFGAIYVDAAGVVTFSAGTATDISLEGISFDTED